MGNKMTDFREFGKIPRLSRECVVTEKIDGTNASIFIGAGEIGESCIIANNHTEADGSLVMKAGSRTRWITPDDDNFGFARWAQYHAEELFTLGPGRHFGEWWGKGIQRGYGLEDRQFSLFNTSIWLNLAVRPACCGVVSVLYEGVFHTNEIEAALARLRLKGSACAPGFANPEGIVVYHVAGSHYYKQTCEHDDEPKNAHVKKDRVPQVKVQRTNGIMWTGGRRHGATAGYAGPERRQG
jgi:hypothetical protein